MARYLNEKVPGIRVPEPLIARLESVPREERLLEGVRIAAETIRTMAPLVNGVHIMTVGAEEQIPAILDLALG
jgi:hypothetical protein